jgi:N6-adenosine-specific RNA methylase IME4
MRPLDTLPSVYRVIHIDVPWEYYGDPDKDQAAGKHYNMMSFEELEALPVRQLIDGKGVLFMWATGPKLAEAIDLIRQWGFYYRGIAYFWIKTTKDGKVKQLGEIVLIGSTQKRGRTLPLRTESQSQYVFAPRPPGHSSKPPEVRERIEELFGDTSRIELFARGCPPGWDAWGMEADKPMPSHLARSTKLKAKLREAEEAERIRELVGKLPQAD